MLADPKKREQIETVTCGGIGTDWVIEKES